MTRAAKWFSWRNEHFQLLARLLLTRRLVQEEKKKKQMKTNQGLGKRRWKRGVAQLKKAQRRENRQNAFLQWLGPTVSSRKKRVNPKTMTLHVLFSTHASCLPLLDRKSQWHLPGGPLDSGCNVTCQYHASVPSWFFALVLMLKTCIKAHAWHDVHCPMKGAGPCWGSSGDCSRICLCDVTLGSRNPGSTHWWH